MKPAVGFFILFVRTSASAPQAAIEDNTDKALDLNIAMLLRTVAPLAFRAVIISQTVFYIKNTAYLQNSNKGRHSDF